MNPYRQVESTLKEILEVIKPLQEDWITRFKIIDELREIVQSIESLRGATVEPFGSFVSNLFTRWGDLDISVEVSYFSCISSAGKKQKQSILGELQRALRQKGGCIRIQFISNARVPILKTVSKWQNISCDISIDNLQGQIKSKFLFWLNEIDVRFRDMVLLVKEWAKANGINNPKSGSFNSYSLTLLVIFHFQTCVPPILPPLKDIYPTNVVDDLTGTKVDAERRIAQVCSSNIAKFRSCRIINRSSLSELFISFIAKFSDINIRASELGICPFTGQWEYIANNMRWLPRTYAIFIEDPFEQPENSARAVSKKQLIKIAEAFEMTRRMLISASLTRNTLLRVLVGPQTSRFLVNHSAGYTSNNGSHYPNPHVQSHRAVQSPLQMQQHRQQEPMYKNSKPSTSQMHHQAPKVEPSTSKVQPQFPKARVPNGPRPNHQFQRRTPSVSQMQPQFWKSRTEGHNVNLGSQRLGQVQYNNQGQMWRPKSDK
ncbi:hypothetical protein HRI_001744900 [Hibiscus trionum]|uniref:Poly(A) RNA polymerase mitochondrial-like central palm domain-containing protein n=1 Tax=Hibiscus trionum TaxID=183268 RepID=A0A9W7HPE8_HIBTR|nr:hypothetical protein HRI_001744900 [Hibiscus trionum]